MTIRRRKLQRIRIQTQRHEVCLYALMDRDQGGREMESPQRMENKWYYMRNTDIFASTQKFS